MRSLPWKEEILSICKRREKTDCHNLGNLVEGEAVSLAVGLLLHQVDYPFDIRGMFVDSSEIEVGSPRHLFDHWFK